MHNLYQGTMAYAGETPWHKLGVQFAEPFTAEEALEAAKLNFNVGVGKLHHFDDKGLPIEEKDYRRTFNETTGDTLGIVGTRFQPLQNRDAFAFFDTLLGEGCRYETAGALGKGHMIWLLAATPEEWSVVPGDPIKRFIMLANGHDGRGAVTARFTDVRAVCQNTVWAAFKDAKATVSLMHTAKVAERLQIAAQVMKQNAEHLMATKQAMGALAACRIDDAWIDGYIKALFGDPKTMGKAGVTRWESKRNLLVDLTQNGLGTEIDGVKGTAYGAYQAAIEYVDHHWPTRESTDRAEAMIAGTSVRFRQLALDEALARI